MSSNPYLDVQPGKPLPSSFTSGNDNPYLSVQPKIVTPSPTVQPKPIPVVNQPIQNTIGNIFQNISQQVTKTLAPQPQPVPIVLPENLKAKPTPQVSVTPKQAVPSAQITPAYYEGPQYKTTTNIIDKTFKDPVGLLYESTYQLLGGNNPDSINSKIYQAENKYIVSNPILNNRLTQDVLRSTIQSTLNFSPSVEQALKTQLPRTVAKTAG